MNKERLLKLADFLDNLNEDLFDLHYVTSFSDSRDKWSFDVGDILRETVDKNFESCGAVACAIGWMPAIFPELHWSTFGIVKDESGKGNSFETASRFLGLEYGKEDMLLFTHKGYPDKNVGPKDVAKAIRHFIAHNGDDDGIENSCVASTLKPTCLCGDLREKMEPAPIENK